MSALKNILLILALSIAGTTAVQAQSYKYNSVRKDYVFDDGFGIPQSKTVKQEGDVRIDRNEVSIDEVKYRRDSDGIYKNEKGKSVDLSYAYNGMKLIAVRISTGHIVNSYLLNQPESQERANERLSASVFTN